MLIHMVQRNSQTEGPFNREGQTKQLILPVMPNPPKKKDYLVLKQINTQGCETWDPKDQDSTKMLLKDNVDFFAANNMDLGKTSKVKNEINLKLGAHLVKHCYRKIPSGSLDMMCLYEDVPFFTTSIISLLGLILDVSHNNIKG